MNPNIKNFKLICDSSIDLTEEIIKEEEIDIMYFPVSLGDTQYEDGITITNDTLFDLIDKTGQLPHTSAFGPKSYDEVIKKYVDSYPDVVFIGLGSGFSSSLNSARIGTEKYDNVHIIDSQNLSSGTGLLVLKICKMRKEGKMASEIVEEINKLVPRVRSQFTLETLTYLHKGGRCSGVSKIFGTLLNIKPIIKVVDNAMVVAKKPIGYSRAVKALIDEAVANKDNIDLDCITITHVMAHEKAEEIIAELSKYFDKSILLETFASTTIATHCGPGTIGILYILKK